MDTSKFRTVAKHTRTGLSIPHQILSNKTARLLAPEISRIAVEFFWARKIPVGKNIDFKPKMLFVWIPKTAGTSIARWLRNRGEIFEAHNVSRVLEYPNSPYAKAKVITFGHQNIDSLAATGLLPESWLTETTAFTVVRNPFSRAISLFSYLKKLRVYKKGESFDKFVNDLVRERPRPGLYNRCGLSMGAPMVSWTRQELWSGPSRFFRFEDLRACEAERCRTLGVAPGLPWVNRSAVGNR
jgi:hypothetical protein